MKDLDQQLREDIKQALYMHGKLSLVFYQMMGEWVVHKWGEYERLETIHRDLFQRYMQAGMVDEANSLTLMELPNDEDLIFRILTCGSLEKTLKEIGYIQDEASPPTPTLHAHKEEQGVGNLSFTQWYRETYKDTWTDNHAILPSLIHEYEDYCKAHRVTPVWDG